MSKTKYLKNNLFERIYKLLTLVIFLFISTFNTSAQLDFSKQEITKTLQTFYADYIQICGGSNIIDAENKLSTVKKGYCTKSLLRRIKRQGLDYDPIINAQDCHPDWIKTITIAKDISRDDLYHVAYGQNEKTVIHLVIKKTKSSYKINKILPEN